MQLLDSVRRGWFPLVGRAEGYASWVSHDDAAAAVVAALGVPAGTYNVVEQEPMQRRQLADAIARLLGVRPPRLLPAWVTRFTGSVGETLARSLRVSNRKLERASGWRPRFPTMLDGLTEVLRGGG
jgi:nucleoside-diphosphate-sugar epimerase